MKESEIARSKAVLVGIAERSSEVNECERSLDELARLLDTAGGMELARILQVKDSFDPRTCIGSGKIKELADGAKLYMPVSLNRTTDTDEVKTVRTVIGFDLVPAV